MDRQPTVDDANLILRLYELRREPRMREARAWFARSFRAGTYEEFMRLCPPGSEENASFRMVSTYWDMVASFITSGVLHAGLFFESQRELLLVWEKVRELAAALRERNKNPAGLKNLEDAANAYIHWMNERAPGHYEVFAANVRAMGNPAGPVAPPKP